jgi:hypothetical protein
LPSWFSVYRFTKQILHSALRKSTLLFALDGGLDLGGRFVVAHSVTSSYVSAKMSGLHG